MAVSSQRMPKADDPFGRSIGRQIALNRARTPTERMMALCELLDAAHAMAPKDPASRERRRRVLAARQRQREQWREQLRRFAAERGADPSAGL